MLSDLVVCYLFLGGAGAGAALLLAVLDLLTPEASQATAPQLAQRVTGRRPRGAVNATNAANGAAITDSAGSAFAAAPPATFATVAPPERFCPQLLYRRLFAPGFAVALVAVCVGAVCLAADLGRLDRLALLITSPTLSFIPLGAAALAVLVLTAGFVSGVWSAGSSRFRRSTVRAVEVALIVSAVAVIVYTGLFLQSVGAIALWDSPFVPVLFTLSSLSCGIACVLCTISLSGSGRLFLPTIARLVRWDAVVIAIELLCLALFIYGALGDGARAGAAETLVAGALAPVFWTGLVAGGLVLPLALELPALGSPYRSLVIALLVLIGGFCLRWCLVMAGEPVDVVASAMAGLGMV